MDRRRLFSLAVGGMLALSVSASIAAGWDTAPTASEVFCLLVATTSALAAGIATAPQKKVAF